MGLCTAFLWLTPSTFFNICVKKEYSGIFEHLTRRLVRPRQQQVSRTADKKAEASEIA